MERKEEIEKAAAKFDGSMDCVGCFIGGAEWADQHPRKGSVDIEKVCQYIKDNLYKYLFVCDGQAGFPTTEFIKYLKSAMEEQV